MTLPAEPAPTYPALHQHRCTKDGRTVVALHEDTPDDGPGHTHPGGYEAAAPFRPGPVPPSAVVHTLTLLRRERAEAELLAVRKAYRTLSEETAQLRRLADALRDALAGGWALPPGCAEYAGLLTD